MHACFPYRSFEELLESYAPRALPQKGDVEQGVIVSITDKGAWIELPTCKTELFAPSCELDETSRVGQTVFFRVCKVSPDDEFIQVSLKGASGWADLIKANQDKACLKVKVLSVKQEEQRISGVRVSLENNSCMGFVPFRLLAVRADKVAALVGKEIEARIEELDPAHYRLVLNRKVIEDEKRNARESFLNSVQKGDQFTACPVVGIAQRDGNEFGIFVDVNGVRGLVYRSEIPGARRGSLSKRFALGSLVNVSVLSIHEYKREGQKRQSKTLSLSIKEFNMDHFHEHARVGDILLGKVEALAEYGAFINLPSGVDGLLHRSEFGEAGILALDEQVQVKVIQIDTAKGRIGLTMRLQAS